LITPVEKEKKVELTSEAIITALEQNWDMVDRALEGLDYEALTRRPNDQCNSIAWLLWHMNRVWDALIHDWLLEGIPQIWVRGGWHQKFGMSDAPEDRGVGWTADQIAAWVAPSREVQLGYYEAVKAGTREFLSTRTHADLEKRMVIPPHPEPRSVAAAIGRRTWDNIAHGGQIAYVRGLYQGMGWYPR
jgi:uncharacterized damage-inducible protein DinB